MESSLTKSTPSSATPYVPSKPVEKKNYRATTNLRIPNVGFDKMHFNWIKGLDERLDEHSDERLDEHSDESSDESSDEKFEINAGGITSDSQEGPLFLAKAKYIKGNDGSQSDTRIQLSLLTHRPDIRIKTIRIVLVKNEAADLHDIKWKNIKAPPTTKKGLSEIKLIKFSSDPYLGAFYSSQIFDRQHPQNVFNNGIIDSYEGVQSAKGTKTFSIFFEIAYQRFLLKENPTEYTLSKKTQ